MMALGDLKACPYQCDGSGRGVRQHVGALDRMSTSTLTRVSGDLDVEVEVGVAYLAQQA